MSATGLVTTIVENLDLVRCVSASTKSEHSVYLVHVLSGCCADLLGHTALARAFDQRRNCPAVEARARSDSASSTTCR